MSAVVAGVCLLVELALGVALLVGTFFTLAFSSESYRYTATPLHQALNGLAFVLAVFLKQIPLSDTAGMVARGEAIGGAEAAAHEAAAKEAAAMEAAAQETAAHDDARRASSTGTPAP